MKLVRDVWRNEIFPLLDDISFLCLQVAFCHTKLTTNNCSRLIKNITKYSIPFVRYFVNNGLIQDARELLICTVTNNNTELFKELITNHCTDNNKNVSLKFMSNHDVIRVCNKENYYTYNWLSVCKTATKYNSLDILKYVIETYIEYTYKPLVVNNCTKLAIENKHLETYKYLYTIWSPNSENLKDDARECCKVGFVDGLRYIICESRLAQIIDDMPESFIESLIFNAINGTKSVNCLQFLIEYFSVPMSVVTFIVNEESVYTNIYDDVIDYLESLGITVVI